MFRAVLQDPVSSCYVTLTWFFRVTLLKSVTSRDCLMPFQMPAVILPTAVSSAAAAVSYLTTARFRMQKDFCSIVKNHPVPASPPLPIPCFTVPGAFSARVPCGIVPCSAASMADKHLDSPKKLSKTGCQLQRHQRIASGDEVVLIVQHSDLEHKGRPDWHTPTGRNRDCKLRGLHLQRALIQGRPARGWDAGRWCKTGGGGCQQHVLGIDVLKEEEGEAGMHVSASERVGGRVRDSVCV